MSRTRIIIFVILILYSLEQSKDGAYSSKCEAAPNPGSDKYVCLDREEDDYGELGIHCCHRTNEYTDGTTKYECELFMENDKYGDIDGYIDDEKRDNSNYKDIKIDCFQKYINYNLILLIAFLFAIN